MSFRFFVNRICPGRFLALLLAALLLPISESAAQTEWQRTVKVIAPVEEVPVIGALTDTVVTMAEANKIPIRRTPASDTTSSLEKIEEELSKEGLALTSATHVFITYRFKLFGGTLRREIRNLHFIYRPTAQQGEDISIFYVDLTKNNLYHELLVDKGTPSPVNEVVYHPFAEQISLQNLKENVTVVQVGNQILRDSDRATTVKAQILQTIERLTYN